MRNDVQRVEPPQIELLVAFVVRGNPSLIRVAIKPFFDFLNRNGILYVLYRTL